MPQPLIKITKTRDNDPTLTRHIAKRWMSENKTRFNALSKSITEYIKSGVLKIDEGDSQTPFILKEFVSYADTPSTIESIDRWLDGEIQDKILSTQRTQFPLSQNDMWWDAYLNQSYDQGVDQSNKDLVAAGIILLLTLQSLRPDQSLIHRDAKAFLFTKNFNSMKGVTDSMKSAIMFQISQGMQQGLSVDQIAKDIVGRVNKIGITRANLIARTETSFAFNFAALNEYKVLENVVGETIYAQWWTMQDERVRARHRTWHGKIFTIEAARGMIGEINCRCSVLPMSKSQAKKQGIEFKVSK